MNEEHFEQVLQFYQGTDYNPRRETLRRRVEDAYPILKQKAGDRELIEYKVLADQIHTDKQRYMSVVLGTISRMEDKAGRPPLSAVVVNKNQQIPSDRFFTLIDQLQYSPEGGMKEVVFENLRDDLAAEWR